MLNYFAPVRTKCTKLQRGKWLKDITQALTPHFHILVCLVCNSAKYAVQTIPLSVQNQEKHETFPVAFEKANLCSFPTQFLWNMHSFYGQCIHCIPLQLSSLECVGAHVCLFSRFTDISSQPAAKQC